MVRDGTGPLPAPVRQRVLVLLAVLALVALLASATRAFASGPPGPSALTEAPNLVPVAGSVGYDISWPQCPSGETPPANANWAIIGVTGGKPTTLNPCFAAQIRWARTTATVPQLYMNMEGLRPGYSNTLCQPADQQCNAYQYGYSNAAGALSYARTNGADARYWWIDVETANYWADDQALNARVIQGTIDYLRNTGHVVGVYSTPRQWRIIAGTFAPNLPVWTAGAADQAEAMTRCTPQYAFGGGTVTLVQYISEHFDMSYVCPAVSSIHRVVVPFVAAGG